MKIQKIRLGVDYHKEITIMAVFANLERPIYPGWNTPARNFFWTDAEGAGAIRYTSMQTMTEYAAKNTMHRRPKLMTGSRSCIQQAKQVSTVTI